MFGHQNDVITQDQKSDASVPLPEETIDALTSAPATASETDSPEPTESAPAMEHVETAPEPIPVTVTPTVVAPTHAMDGFIAPSAQIAAATTFSTYAPAPAAASTTPDPSRSTTEPPITGVAAQPGAPAAIPPPSTPIAPMDPEDLLKIKHEALQSLSPLIGQLNLGPEEKFRTLMMLIQASDNHSLLTQAYEIAQTISSEKARAQALLDVVNEINYFTNQSQKNTTN